MLPDIPITELFSYQEFPMERVALRWYSSKTTMDGPMSIFSTS